MSRLTRIYSISNVFKLSISKKENKQKSITTESYIFLYLLRQMQSFFSKKEFISNLSKKSPSIACLKVDKLGGVS